jgi:hypothetical protein
MSGTHGAPQEISTGTEKSMTGLTGTRIALLLGVANTPDAPHRFVPLEDPVSVDQRLLGASLMAAGYTVETLYDATRAEITDPSQHRKEVVGRRAGRNQH